MMIGANLKKMRLKRGLSQTDAAAALGISNTTLCVYEREDGTRTPTVDLLIRMAKLYECTTDALLGSGEALTLDSHDDAMRPIPVVGTVAAGIPQEAIQGDYGTVLIPADWRGDYFGLIVSSDSMEPRYMVGDTVVVRSQPTCDSGNDAIVYVGDDYEATLKTVKFAGPDVVLQPVNPRYESRRFPGGAGIRICGVVKRVIHDV